MDKDKAIRSAKLTAAGILDKRRAKTAVERAGGQIAPSKYLPGVPRQVHAAGGYVPQASIAYKSLPVGQAPAIGGGTSLGDFAQMASMMGGKGEAVAPQSQHHQNDGHDHSGMSDAALQAWNKLTDAYGQPLTIVSGYRDPQQNEAAGGAKGSQHLHGNAYDIDTSGMSHEDRLALATQAYNSGFRGFGFYDNNMHFDVGDQRAWGPSYSSDSIPEWAQPFVQQYVARADGGKVENFQSWFGNSVTHTDGEPHVFYTGTSKDKDFTAFNVGRHGAWFTRDPEVASSYADQNDSQGYKWEGGRPIKTNTASRVIPVYVKAENPYTGEYSGATTGNYKSDQSNWFDSLRAKGHDAWIPASSQGQLAVVLREPQQIKSIYNNGKFDPSQKHMNRATGGRTVNKLNMYSKAAEVARSLPQAKGSVDQMLAMLRKGGVKPAELEHAGRPSGDMIDRETLAKHFEDALPKVRAEQYGEQPHSMTQNENQEYNHLMNRHHASQYRTGAGRPEPLSPEELERFEGLRSRLSRKDPISIIETGEDEGPADTTYHDYQTPGGKDYRERLLTLPKRKGTPSWTVSGPSMLVSREHDTKEAADADAAQMNSRLSPDIHPSRRHRVFETTRKSPDNYQSGHWGNNANVLAHIRMKDVPVDGRRALHIEEIQSDWAQEGRKQGFKPTDGSSAAKDALPNAPYVKNTAHWTDLALKNVLAEAAHGRYDHVTFTGGQEQADRYGLEKSLSAIHYTPETKTLHAERIGQHRPIIQQDVAPEQVASYIGSEAANKLLDPSNAYEVGGIRRHSLVDDDLKMGGEGMKGYYDNILPKAAMKLVQQHDPSIQPSTINGNFGFTMTPKARESILQGQPAFAKGGEVDDPMVGHHNTSGKGVALYRSQPDLMFKNGGKAMALTRGFTKNGSGVMMSLKSKGK